MAMVASDDKVSLEALHARLRELQAENAALQAERDRAARELEEAKQQAKQLAQQSESFQKQAVRFEQRAERLAWQVKRLAYLLYGRRSEKLDAEQLGQLVLAFGGNEQDAAAADPVVPHPEGPQEPIEDDPPPSGKKKRRNHPGRTKLSPEIERRVTPVSVPEHEQQCACCGKTMDVFSVVEHERVEHVPEKLVVHVEQREVRGCKHCRGDAVTAPRKAPAAVRRVGSSLLAMLIENKCDDALPIYRQADRLRRLGFDVPVNTLYGYFAHATDLLAPVAKTTLSTVLGQYYVQVDDTKLKVLDKRHRKGRHLGHLWCFTGPGPLVAYAFTESWKAEDIAPYLFAIDSFIQCDDYKGYGTQIRGPDGVMRSLVPPELRLGCMMHVRRRFYVVLQMGDKRASEPILCIRELYQVEAEAKARQLGPAERLALRTEKSMPWLDRFDAWVDAHEKLVTPSSKLAQAITYAKQQRPFIRRCFSDGHFEIDNGKPERAIREPAIGRRNYHFTGSADAAERLSGAYTLVQSCRALGVSSRDYLIDVLDKIDSGWPMRRIGELVPDRWAQDRGLLTPSNESAQ